MTVADFYRVAIVGQKIVVKDVNKSWEVVYKGDIDHISFIMYDRHIRWLGTSDVYVGTIELIIE